jgi:hypothetical protein
MDDVGCDPNPFAENYLNAPPPTGSDSGLVGLAPNLFARKRRELSGWRLFAVQFLITVFLVIVFVYVIFVLDLLRLRGGSP